MDPSRFATLPTSVGHARSRRTVRQPLRAAALGAFGARTRAVVAVVVVAVLGAGLAPGAARGAQAVASPVATPVRPGPGQCRFPFDGTVYRGPDAGLRLSGELTLTIGAGGDTTGVLVGATGQQTRMVGQVLGRSLTVLFALGGGRFLSGLGTADSPIAGCAFTVLFGPFVGPRPDDSGTWDYRCSKQAPTVSCEPSPTFLGG